MIDVTLTWFEVSMGTWLGSQRQMNSIRDGRKDAHGFDGDGWKVAIEGACGEIVVAKALNRYWEPTVNTFKRGGDVGRLQVRTRSKHYYDLPIRKDDRETDAFVLVTGKPPSFIIRGWIRGKDAQNPDWVQTYGDRPPAWFVLKTD